MCSPYGRGLRSRSHWCPGREETWAALLSVCSSGRYASAGRVSVKTAAPCHTALRSFQSSGSAWGPPATTETAQQQQRRHLTQGVMSQRLQWVFITRLIWLPGLTSPWRRVLGEGLKKLCRIERSLLNRAASFSTMYCFRRGETSSPNRAWLSCQICLFTSTAQTLYSSLSAITIFSFFSGTCRREHVIKIKGSSTFYIVKINSSVISGG